MKVQEAKKVLNSKLKDYKLVFSKVKDATGVNDPLELNNLIIFLERTEDLANRKVKSEEKVKEMRLEKESLE